MKYLPVVILLLLIACGQAESIAKETPIVGTQIEVPKTTIIEQEPTIPTPPAEEKASLVDALAQGKSVKCITRVGQQTSTLYIKEGKVRMDTMPANAHGIYTETMMYTWTGSKGAMMNLEVMQNIAGNIDESYEPETPERIVARAEKNDANCEPATIAEDQFEPPVDVEFQDMTEILRKLQNVVGSQTQ